MITVKISKKEVRLLLCKINILFLNLSYIHSAGTVIAPPPGFGNCKPSPKATPTSAYTLWGEGTYQQSSKFYKLFKISLRQHKNIAGQAKPLDFYQHAVFY